MIDLFPQFESCLLAVNGVQINARTGGAGPPLLLLHGHPQTHAIWHRVAPELEIGRDMGVSRTPIR
jgi:haloacetate dehalogenase